MLLALCAGRPSSAHLIGSTLDSHGSWGSKQHLKCHMQHCADLLSFRMRNLVSGNPMAFALKLMLRLVRRELNRVHSGSD